MWDFTSAKDAATVVGRHLQKGDLMDHEWHHNLDETVTTCVLFFSLGGGVTTNCSTTRYLECDVGSLKPAHKDGMNMTTPLGMKGGQSFIRNEWIMMVPYNSRRCSSNPILRHVKTH